MKKTAVVILNWNGKKLLEQFLPSVIKYTLLPHTEIVVADNGSTDNSIDFISRRYPEVKIIRLEKNYGYAGGYNEALKQIDTEYFVLLNSDVEVTENWLQPMTDYLDNNQCVAALQPKLLSCRNKPYFEYAGAAGGFLDKYGYPFCRGRIFSTIEKDNGQYNDISEIFWASGACLIIRKKDFFDAGEFDSTFFAHMEEIDLCWRLQSKGRKIIYFPQSKVYHLGAATLAKENPEKTFLNFRNNLLMLYKNLPQNNVKKIIRIRRLLDYLAIMQMIITGKFENAKAVLHAHKEVKNTIPNYSNIRKELMEKAVITDIKTMYPKSILRQYYLKRKKVFSKLGFNPSSFK